MIQFPFISGSKSSSLLKPLTITENGNYTVPQGFDGFCSVYIAVNPVIASNSFRVSAGNIKPYGYKITALSHPSACAPLTATANGMYLPPEGYDGFNTVTVNVTQPHMVRNCYCSYPNFTGRIKTSATIAVTA